VLLTTAISLGLLLPVVVLAFVVSGKGKAALKPVLLFAGFALLDNAVIWLMKLVKVVPDWGGWNWQGKVLEAGLPVLLALALPAAFAAKRMGLRLPESKRSWRETALTCVLYLVIGVPLILLTGAHFGLTADAPTYAYEATMPGLGEEIMYRGLMLMVLNEAFGRPWKFAGIQFGWGFVIVSALFGILHGVDAPSVDKVQIVWMGMLFPFLTGIVLAWLRERTGSVWPGVVFHNFVNTVNQFLH
jgi:hypothetical protein